jgi:CheY-like chemotaxis protein
MRVAVGKGIDEHVIDVLRAHGCDVGVGVGAADVLLVAMPGESALPASCSTYVIGVLAEDADSQAVTSALEAGCHDVLQLPFSDAELWARVDVLDRLAGWPLAPHGSRPTQRTVAAARAWRFLGDIVTQDLEQVLGMIELSRRAPMSPPIRIATIPMVFARDNIELAISIVADKVACAWLAATLIGDPNADDAAIDDALRELANVAGGALKRAILPEGLVLSTGLPVGGDARLATELNASATVRSWCLAVDTGAVFTVIADVRPRPNRHVPARSLREGMVIVGDVRTETGALLVDGGTRLTSSTAEHLGRLLGVTLVEVSPAA